MLKTQHRSTIPCFDDMAKENWFRRIVQSLGPEVFAFDKVTGRRKAALLVNYDLHFGL